MEDQEQALDIKHYLQVIYKKRYLFIMVAAGIITVITAASYIVPNNYEATTTVSIQKNYLNALMRDVTVAPSMDDQVKALSVVMTSRSNLLRVLTDLGIAMEKKTEMEAAFVVGADGYNSRVRRMLNIDYPEVGQAEYFAVFEFRSDADLQNDPADIPRFLEKIAEGNDIVCGWRHKRQDKLISRKIPSMVANWIIGKITGVPIKDNGCSLKAYRADIIKSIPLYSDMHRFIPAMTSMAGTSVAQLRVNHSPRRFGVSKYGISRIYKVIIDLLVIKTLLAFSSRPMHLFATGGLLSMGLGMFTLFLALKDIFRQGSVDFMLASGGLLFLILAFFLVLVGFLCELINKTGSFRTLAHLKETVE